MSSLRAVCTAAAAAAAAAVAATTATAPTAASYLTSLAEYIFLIKPNLDQINH